MVGARATGVCQARNRSGVEAGTDFFTCARSMQIVSTGVAHLFSRQTTAQRPVTTAKRAHR
jgi:hypothetical protein